MNEKLARQIEKALSQTYGVEVEMNNITREKAAKTAATFFGTGRYEYTAHRNGYEKHEERRLCGHRKSYDFCRWQSYS